MLNIVSISKEGSEVFSTVSCTPHFKQLMSRILKISGTSRFDCHKLLYHVLVYIGWDVENIFHGRAAPSGPEPPHNRGFTMTNTTHAVGLLWMSDGFISGTVPDNTQYSQGTDIHTPGGIRTRNPSKRVAGPSLKPCGTGIEDLGYRNVNYGIFKYEIQYYRR